MMETKKQSPGIGDHERAVNTAKSERLDNEELKNLGDKLLVIATKAARKDALDRGAASIPQAQINNPSMWAGTLAVWFRDIIPIPPSVSFPVLTVSTSNVILFGLRNRYGKNPNLHLPRGNAIQCLRISNESSFSDKGKVALAIHSYDHGASEEARGKTRLGLAEALEVIGLAHKNTDKKNQFACILVPESVVRHAGLRIEAAKSYEDVISDIAEEPARVPYKEGVVVFDPDVADKVAERLHSSNNEGLTDRVFEELAKRNPNVEDLLKANNPNVLQTIHSILLKLTYSEGAEMLWQKDMEDGIWTGTRMKVRQDIMPMVNISFDPYNPRIIYRSSQTGEEQLNQTLRTMTGGEMNLISRRLEEGTSVSDFELVRLALDLLEQNQAETGLAHSKDEESSVPNNDKEMQFITVGEGVDKWKHRRRQAARVFMGSLALFSLTQVGMLGLEELDPIKSIDSSPAVSFRVDNHGLEQSSPYWAEEAKYIFHNGDWFGEEQEYKMLHLPRQLANPSVPHLTVTTVLNEGEISLPVENDTKLAAFRAYDIHRNSVNVPAYRRSDGVIFVDVDKMADGAFLEYDLVKGDGPSIQANQPLSVIGKMYENEAWKKVIDGPEEGARYINDNFIYDNAQYLKEELADKDSPSEYVNHLFKEGRCQCLQCNTQVAILESKARPKQDMALVEGFLHPRQKNEDHSYLVEKHAWLNNGNTIDATASKKDGNSSLPQYTDTEAIDQIWNVDDKLEEARNRERISRTAKISLVGAATFGIAWLEHRRRLLQRTAAVVTNVARRKAASIDIDPNDALQLMGWQAYGKFESPIPRAVLDHVGAAIPSEQTIPTSTLGEVASGGFRASGQLNKAQQRGLRRTAAAMLSSRDRKEKQSK